MISVFPCTQIGFISLKTDSKHLNSNHVFSPPHCLSPVQDNEVKRCRAMRKVSRQRELTNQKQADLLALQEEMKSLIKERDKLVKRVRKNAVYHMFLDRAVQACEQWISIPANEGPFQFQDVRQVMCRYDTLKLTREDLLQITQQNQENIEKSRAELADFIKQGNDTLLHYNNTLAQLQSQLDKAREERMIWESRWAHIQNTAAKKTLLLGTIKMAILNLYQSMCKRSKDTGEVPIAPEDTFKQLEKIQTFLSDLIAVWEEVRRMARLTEAQNTSSSNTFKHTVVLRIACSEEDLEQRWNVFSVARAERGASATPTSRSANPGRTAVSRRPSKARRKQNKDGINDKMAFFSLFLRSRCGRQLLESKAWMSKHLQGAQLFAFKLRMPSSKGAFSHDALLEPEDKRTVAKIPADLVAKDLEKMLAHSLLKGIDPMAVCGAQQISLCLWRLSGPTQQQCLFFRFEEVTCGFVEYWAQLNQQANTPLTTTGPWFDDLDDAELLQFTPAFEELSWGNDVYSGPENY
ncbi:hypothetical protein NFI96_019278 [Prochilodus magdalenae]|nr:hypothetical protein NFI96_019278 [Prochilodus magdalenae]